MTVVPRPRDNLIGLFRKIPSQLQDKGLNRRHHRPGRTVIGFDEDRLPATGGKRELKVGPDHKENIAELAKTEGS